MLNLGKIGLGTFPFASPFTEVKKDMMEDILDTYIKNGGKYIDVAPTYAYGNVERDLGEILKKYRREDYFINSFCGYILDDKTKSFVKSGKYDDVIEDCEESLKRLKVDFLDSYGVHIPDSNTPFSETMDALTHLKNKGKIKRIGVSNVSLDELIKYNYNGDINYVQMRFSLLTQGLTMSKEFINYCEDHKIDIVVYQVIDRGLLTSNVINGVPLQKQDLRNSKPEFNNSIQNYIGHWVEEQIQPIAKSANVSIATLIIYWTVQQRWISLCQMGATNTNQLRQILAAQQLDYSQEIIDKVSLAYKYLEESLNNDHNMTVLEFMGLAENPYGNMNASGKTN